MGTQIGISILAEGRESYGVHNSVNMARFGDQDIVEIGNTIISTAVVGFESLRLSHWKA
ncbi:MAG: hypothetical protein U0930_16385 [Pirellulales bacterium]